MSDFKIVIPSYKRPERVLAAEWCTEAYIAIHEGEKAAYAATYGEDRLIVMPTDVQGNIARVRNWILDHVGGNIVMMDDDVRYLSRTENRECNPLSQQEALEFFENGFIMCEDIGAYLWGMQVTPDRLLYCEYTPFSTQAPVLATVCCHRAATPLRYDERIPLKEDYDFYLQNLKRFRKVLRFNMYHYHPEHITNSGGGGCIAYRTMDRERECADLLVKKWGSRIVHVDFDRSLNPIIKSPLAGV